MSNTFYNVTIENIDLNTGESWELALPFRLFNLYYSIYNKVQPRDKCYIGCDTQKPAVYYLAGDKLTINRSGSDVDSIDIFFGAIGNRISTANSQNSISLVGDRDIPYLRGGFSGSNFIELSASYTSITGVNIEAVSTVVNHIDADIAGLVICDLYVNNVDYGYNCTGNYKLENAKFENIHGKDVSGALIRIPANSKNITISNFSCTNTSSEAGEFRGINIRDNSENVTIKDGEIFGGVDHYDGLLPEEYGDYNQGDGISAEVGVGLTIDNVTVKDCTDRGIDVKAVAHIRDSSISCCKIGVATWGSGSILERVTVLNPRGNSVNQGVCFQAVAKTSYYNCKAMLGVNYTKGVFDVAQEATIIGGEYILPVGKYFIRSTSSSVSVKLINVNINGAIYNESLKFTSSSQTWSPN